MQRTSKGQGKAEELENEQQFTASSQEGCRAWKGSTKVKAPGLETGRIPSSCTGAAIPGRERTGSEQGGWQRPSSTALATGVLCSLLPSTLP